MKWCDMCSNCSFARCTVASGLFASICSVQWIFWAFGSLCQWQLQELQRHQPKKHVPGSSNLTRECSEGCAKSMCTHASMHTSWYTLIRSQSEMRRRCKTSAQLSHVCWKALAGGSSANKLHSHKQTAENKPRFISVFFPYFPWPVATSDSGNSFILSHFSTCQPHLASAPNKCKEMSIWKENERGESFGKAPNCQFLKLTWRLRHALKRDTSRGPGLGLVIQSILQYVEVTVEEFICY